MVRFIIVHRLLDVELYFGTDGKSDEKEEKEIVTPDGASPEEEAYFEYLRQQQALEPEVKKDYLFYRFNLNLKDFETIRPQIFPYFSPLQFQNWREQLRSRRIQIYGYVVDQCSLPKLGIRRV